MNVALVVAIPIIFLIHWYVSAKKNAAGRDRTSFEFLQMSGDMQHGRFAATFVASSISLATIFVGISEFASQYGPDAWWLLVAFVLGMLVFLFHVRRLEPFFRGNRTIAGALGVGFDSQGLRKIVALCSALYLVGFVGIELYVIYLLMVAVFPSMGQVGGLVCLCAVSLILVAYCLQGGYRGITHNDKSQLIVIMVATILILGMTLHLLASDTVSPQGGLDIAKLIPLPIYPIPWSRLLIIGACFALMVPWLTSTADTWHRCVAAKFDRKTIQKGTFGLFFLNIIGFIGVWAAAIIIGVVFKKSNENLDVFSSFLIDGWETIRSEYWVISSIVFGIILSGILGAVLSSVDTLLMSFSFVVCSDLLIRHEDISSPRETDANKFFVFIGGILALMIPLVAVVLRIDIFHTISSVGSSIIVVFPCMLTLGIFRYRCQAFRVSRKFAIVSVVGSLGLSLVVLSYAVWFAPSTDYKEWLLSSVPLIGLTVAFLCMFAYWLVMCAYWLVMCVCSLFMALSKYFKRERK